MIFWVEENHQKGKKHFTCPIFHFFSYRVIIDRNLSEFSKFGINEVLRSLSMSLLKSTVTLTAFTDWGGFIGMGERAEDGDGDGLVSRCCLQVVEFVGAGNHLGWCLEDLEGLVVASALLVDLGLAVVDKVSVFLADLAVLGGSGHHGFAIKKIWLITMICLFHL